MQNESNQVYDLIGIGIGPMNLGLSALCSEHPHLQCLFVDSKPSFDWHPDLMLRGARMQVPWLADLVTLVSPCNKFIFTNFLKAKKRLITFAVTEQQHILRKEYNQYCKWVASQLPNLHFNTHCEAIRWNDSIDSYTLHCLDRTKGTAKTYLAKSVVIGTGSVPKLPANIPVGDTIIHSAEFLRHKPKLTSQKHLAIIGSGQSAAEIFYELLTGDHSFESLRWFTRTDHFPQMDVSSFVAEMASPDYIRYFYGLREKQKQDLLARQRHFYNGVNNTLLADIYNELYLQSLEGTPCRPELFLSHELIGLASEMGKHILSFHRTDTDEMLDFEADAVILATGYQTAEHRFLLPVKQQINFTNEGDYKVQKNYSIDLHHRLYVQNCDLKSHGFNSADLGMAPYRNAVILNSILKSSYYDLDEHVTFQKFASNISKSLPIN